MGLRVLIVGFGFMGQTHAGNVLKNARCELAGIVDPCPPSERLSTIKGNKATVTVTADDIRGIPHFTDMDDALAKSAADAVIVALPTKLHYSSVMNILSRGLHVMVEKPFSIDIGECRRMTSLAKEKNCVLAVGYVVRRMKEYIKLRETYLSGRLGRLKHLSLSRFTGVPGWGNWNDPEFIKASGGALFDLTSHDIDFSRHMLGEPDEIVADKIICREFGGNMISAVLRCGGVNVRIDGGFVTPATFPFRRNYTAFFEKGTLFSDAPGDYNEADAKGVTTEKFEDDNPYYSELDKFVDAVVKGDASDVCTGADAQKTIECCHEIARQRQ